MKKTAITFTLFMLFLSFSACRKINYEEGDKIPRRKFLETINGVWEVEHFYNSIDLNTYSDDSIPVWNRRLGGEGKITIDYYNKITINYGNHIAVSYFSNKEKTVGFSYFTANYHFSDELSKDTVFTAIIQDLPINYDVVIIKLNKNRLVLSDAVNHGDRLELTKK